MPRDSMRNRDPKRSYVMGGNLLNKLADANNARANTLGTTNGQTLDGVISGVNPALDTIIGVAIILATTPSSNTYDADGYPVAPWPEQGIYQARFKYWNGSSAAWSEDTDEFYVLDSRPYWTLQTIYSEEGRTSEVKLAATFQLNEGDVVPCYLDRRRSALIPIVSGAGGSASGASPIRRVRLFEEGNNKLYPGGEADIYFVDAPKGDLYFAKRDKVYDPSFDNCIFPKDGDFYVIKNIEGKWVPLGEQHGLIRYGVTMADLFAGGHCEVELYDSYGIIGYEQDAYAKVEAYFTWMTDNARIDKNTEVTIRWVKRDNRWMIIGAACNPGVRDREYSSASSSSSLNSSSSSTSSATTSTSSSNSSTSSLSTSTSSSSSIINVSSSSSSYSSPSQSSQSSVSSSSSSTTTSQAETTSSSTSSTLQGVTSSSTSQSSVSSSASSSTFAQPSSLSSASTTSLSSSSSSTSTSASTSSLSSLSTTSQSSSSSSTAASFTSSSSSQSTTSQTSGSSNSSSSTSTSRSSQSSQSSSSSSTFFQPSSQSSSSSSSKSSQSSSSSSTFISVTSSSSSNSSSSTFVSFTSSSSSQSADNSSSSSSSTSTSNNLTGGGPEPS